jgi:hypothetical protein
VGVTAFEVETTDGSIGKIDESINAPGQGYFVGRRHRSPDLRKKVTHPAGIVGRHATHHPELAVAPQSARIAPTIEAVTAT